MKRRELLKNLTLAIPALYLSNKLNAAEYLLGSPLSEDISGGIFKPTWQSLKQFKTPQWFRDAKFGIWAHWGPQCQPENGDWYARSMYDEGSKDYNFHLKKYGHPSKFGFKDVINEWKAENWNPDELVALYKDSGAKYFMAMANHHDNLDLYDSKYQQWNSLRVGPKKDIIGGWEKAARKNGLHFGVSVHASHAWNWYETSQRVDKTGAFANIPYDGKLTKKDGKGTWWEGFDPQELYEQNHPLSEGSDNVKNIHKQWEWGNGVALPSNRYCNKFLNRTIDLIDKYNPDLVYFDDTALPLWPISDAGLKIAAHLYNKSIKENKTQEAVIFGKILDEEQRQCMVWDIERGKSNIIEPLPWQTDTCIGQWHYKRSIFEEHKYKSAKTVIHILIDVVSKNGNLCLNIPVRGDGTIDDDEKNVVLEIGEWMKTNSEAIYETRPWKIFGEGPAQENVTPLVEQGYNEVSGKPFSSLDYRFTVKGNALYVIGLGWPENGKALIKSLSMGNSLYPHSINRVELLGDGELKFVRRKDSLEVTLPSSQPKLSYAFALRIT